MARRRRGWQSAPSYKGTSKKNSFSSMCSDNLERVYKTSFRCDTA